MKRHYVLIHRKTRSEYALDMNQERHEKNPFALPGSGSCAYTLIGTPLLLECESRLDIPTTPGSPSASKSSIDTAKYFEQLEALSLSFDLFIQGSKALSVLFWLKCLYHEPFEIVLIDTHVRQTYLRSNPDPKGKIIRLSQPTFARGLSNLVHQGLIAKTVRAGVYWVNPMVFTFHRASSPSPIGTREHQMIFPI